jgi:hypothetical protein
VVSFALLYGGIVVSVGLLFARTSKKIARPARTRRPKPTPIPIPAFAPELSPDGEGAGDGIAESAVEDDDDGDDDDVCTEVLDTADIEEVAENDEVGDEAAFKTRKPGLDSWPEESL